VDLILAKDHDKKIKIVTKSIEIEFRGLDGFLWLSQIIINMCERDSIGKL